MKHIRGNKVEATKGEILFEFFKNSWKFNKERRLRKRGEWYFVIYDKSNIFPIFFLLVTKHYLLDIVVIPIALVIFWFRIVLPVHVSLELWTPLQFLYLFFRVVLNTPQIVYIAHSIVAVWLFRVFFIIYNRLLFVCGQNQQRKHHHHQNYMKGEEVRCFVEVEQLDEVLNDCHHFKL